MSNILPRILLLTLLTIILSQLALAEELRFENIEILQDGDRIFSTSGTSGSFDIEPDTDLRIKIKLKNYFNDDIDFDDLKVEAFIDGLDDDTYDSDITSVNDGRYRIVSLKLEIPSDASSYEDYELKIIAKGDDTNGDHHEIEAEFDVEVDRDEYNLEFERFDITNPACDGDSILHVKLENAGEEDQFDVELEVKSHEVGKIYHDIFDLDALENDDSIYEITKRIDLSEISPGLHTIRALVDYEGRFIEKSTQVNVDSCALNTNDNSNNNANKITGSATSNSDKYVATEEMTNKNRDLSFLYGDPDQEVEVQMPIAQHINLGVKPARTNSNSGLATLVIANIAIIIIILGLLGWYYMPKPKEKQDEEEYKFY